MKHLFLDLEDTVVTPVTEGWHNVSLMNVDKIKKFINEFKPDTVNIFSFAIHDEHDLKGFNLSLRDWLERELDVTLNLVPTLFGDILPVCCKMLKLGNGAVSFQDLRDFVGKQEAFRMFVRSEFKNCDIVLIDDLVFNEKSEWPDLNVTCTFLNVESM